jgi:predicted TIM-barrel fold metal-dependent hydrolase
LGFREQRGAIERSEMSAVDTHAHIYPQNFAIPPGPGHKPEPYERKTREDYLQILSAHGMTHGVLVQPSGYQTDNGAIVDAMAWRKGTIKGIAMVPYGITDNELAELTARGIVGDRFNLVDLDAKELLLPEAQRMLDRLREIGWYAEIHVFAKDLPGIAPILEKHAGQLIFCHMGRPDPELGARDPGFQRYLEFGRSGKAIAKLTGAIRISKTKKFPFEDVDPFVEATLEAFTLDRVIWGSDWPFVILKQAITYDRVVEWFHRVVPSEADRKKILWETPAQLFGFTA